jgi:small subunit ribosomal protein S18
MAMQRNPNDVLQPPMAAASSPFRNRQQVVRKKTSPMKESRIVDYLDHKFLSRFINDQGKILPRRITGLTAFQQREISRAVKYARHLALIPFVAQDTK